MRRIFASLPFLITALAALAALVVAAPAAALPAGVPYTATVDGFAAGTLVFALETQIPGGACRYDVAWDYGAGIFGEQCLLDEALSLGHFSCPTNALGPVPSIVVLAPGQNCHGFDGTGQSSPVFMLLLGESGTTGALDGLLQFTAATQSISAFHAVPAYGPYLVSRVRTAYGHTLQKAAP